MVVEEDRISKDFDGATIFITGGTGFLGKILIEKFLRCCIGLKRIYLLARHKKDKTPEERLHDIFSNVLFSLLETQQPEAIKKCKIIPGDIGQVDLGISPEDRKILQDEVDFIYHSAASMRIDDPVKLAVEINTRGTKFVLDLAEQCKKLKVFVHVSTAFAFPQEKVLHEQFYKPPADPHYIIDKIESGNEDETEALLGDSPNTYTFSKALAEGLVAQQEDKLPVIIVRPSVVCPTWQQPMPGWCNNLQGPMGLFVGAGKGIIRTMYMKSDFKVEFVPADCVIDGMLVSTWNYLHNSKKDQVINLATTSEPLQNHFTWLDIIETGKYIIYNEIPFNGAVWYPGGNIKHSKLINSVCFYLFQLIPAILIDAVLIILGYKPVFYQIQRKIQKGGEVFEYYTKKSWNFSTLKISELNAKTNAREKEIYKLDGRGFDLVDYLRNCILAVRRNNLKESDDTLPAAKRHMKVMWTVDMICKSLFVFAVFYYSYKWTLDTFKIDISL